MGTVTTGRSFRFEFPLPYNRNSNRIEAAKALAREKKRYYQMLDDLLLRGLLPKPPTQRPLTYAVATISYFLRQRMDDDNATIRSKWPQDWLKKRGYIFEDRAPYLRLANTPEQTIDRTGRDPVMIYHLIEIPDEPR